jgi:hypothetical protein
MSGSSHLRQAPAVDSQFPGARSSGRVTRLAADSHKSSPDDGCCRQFWRRTGSPQLSRLDRVCAASISNSKFLRSRWQSVWFRPKPCTTVVRSAACISAPAWPITHVLQRTEPRQANPRCTVEPGHRELRNAFLAQVGPVLLLSRK